MALRQLINKSCNSPDAVFRTIRDFLAAANGIDDFGAGGPNPGPGYEIVDASYASGDPTSTTNGDWCVLRSHGEANSYPVYVRLNFGVSQHGINPYLHWDAENHVGALGMARNTNVYHNGAGEVLLWIYADLDEIHIVIRPQSGSNYFWHPCGRLKPDMLLYDGAAVRVEAAVEAGENTEIGLPSWPGWAEIGRKIYSWDASGLNVLTITGVDEARRVIAVDRSWAREAGSWLAEDLLLFAASAHNSTAGGSETLYMRPSHLDAEGAVSGSVAGNAILPAVAGMDAKYGRRYGCDVWLQRTNEIRGRLANARSSRYSASPQGAAWTDDEGRGWRLHTVYNGSVMAFREAD